MTMKLKVTRRKFSSEMSTSSSATSSPTVDIQENDSGSFQSTKVSVESSEGNSINNKTDADQENCDITEDFERQVNDQLLSFL